MVEEVLDGELELAAREGGEGNGGREDELARRGGDARAGRADAGVGEVEAVTLDDDLGAFRHLERGEVEGQEEDGLFAHRGYGTAETEGTNCLFSSNCD